MCGPFTQLKDAPWLGFIPAKNASLEPVLDDITLLIAGALEKSVRGDSDMESVKCSCGVMGSDVAITLPSGHITHSLCVHIVAFHRDEMMPGHLETIREFQFGKRTPPANVLMAPAPI